MPTKRKSPIVGSLTSNRFMSQRRVKSFEDGAERLLAVKTNNANPPHVLPVPDNNVISNVPSPTDHSVLSHLASSPGHDSNESPEDYDPGLVNMDDDDFFDVMNDVAEEGMELLTVPSPCPDVAQPILNFPLTPQPLVEVPASVVTPISTNVLSSTCETLFKSPHMIMAMELQSLCNSAQVPLHFFDDFLRLFKKHSRNNLQFEKVPTRSRLLKILKSHLPFSQPSFIPIPDNKFDVVPKFDFMAQVLDLFSSEFFKSTDQCCVNAKLGDPSDSLFKKYIPPPGEGYSEMTSGQWYHDTHARVIGKHSQFNVPGVPDPFHNWLLPLIFYNDKTGVSAMEGSYTLEPLMFSLGVIRRTAREKDGAWRHLGFIPACTDPSTKSSPESHLRFTHQCLSILLSDLVAHQKDPPCVQVKIFGKEYRLRLIFEVAFVIGDQLSQDTHCCRKKINTGGAGRVHRSCVTSFLQAANPPLNSCHMVSKSVLDNLCAIISLHEDTHLQKKYVDQSLAQLVFTNNEKIIRLQLQRSLKVRSQTARDILEKVYSLYPVPNAWSNVSFGSNINGIHRATLDDPMHYNSSGLFQYLAEIAFGGLLPKEQEEVEKYMREDAAVRCSVRYDLPRGKFSAGFTSCTLLTASEKVGLMYSLYLGLGTERISNIYKTSILRQQIKYQTLPSLHHQETTVLTDVNESPNDTLLVPASSTTKTPAKLTGRSQKGHAISTSTKKKVPRTRPGSPLPPPQNKTPSGVILSFPKIGDEYFFKTPSFPRTKRSITSLLNDLNDFALLHVVAPDIPHYDELHVEFLCQCIHERITLPREKRDRLKPPEKRKTAFMESHLRWKSEVLSTDDIQRISKVLFVQLRLSVNAGKNIALPVIPTCMQRCIKKHCFEKVKQPGIGDTSAILTDIDGFRKVLENALMFHAAVHEFHELDSTQQQLELLQSKLYPILDFISRSVYRGDQSIDMLTCKMHSHFHLVNDIRYFGSPMGFDAGKGERNLKAWAKQISKTARKCGQTMFIQQTSQRVCDYLVLERARQVREQLVAARHPPTTPQVPKQVTGWVFGRKTPHLSYNLLTEMVSENGIACGAQRRLQHLSNLLTPRVIETLYDAHPNATKVHIWKEMRVFLGEGLGHHNVRAYHEFDQHGSFFDWVHLSKLRDVKHYFVAKVLLLYETYPRKEAYALVWASQKPTDLERRAETFMTARHSMETTKNGLPVIQSVPMGDLEKCIRVHEHWTCKLRRHIPNTALPNNHGQDLRKIFMIDEVYEKYSWLLNFLGFGG